MKEKNKPIADAAETTDKEQATAEQTGKKQKSKKENKAKGKTSPDSGVSPQTSRTAGDVTPSSKYKYVIQNRKVQAVSRRRKMVLICVVFLTVAVLVGGAVYGILNLIQYNNFRILVDQSGTNILSLSSNRSFESGSEVLNLNGPDAMDNITFIDVLPILEEIEAHDGTYTGKDSKYLASTFYLKNITSKQQIFTEEIAIKGVTKNVDTAMRILVVRDGGTDDKTLTIYSKGKDGQPEEVCPGQKFTRDGVKRDAKPEDIWYATMFENNNTVYHHTDMILPAESVRKYTVIIWLEGWDEDCVNDILGGTLDLDINFFIQ